MLNKLKVNLKQAIKKIINSSGVDEDLIKALAKDVQRALLQADVNVKLVFNVSSNLEKRAITETTPPGL